MGFSGFEQRQLPLLAYHSEEKREMILAKVSVWTKIKPKDRVIYH